MAAVEMRRYMCNEPRFLKEAGLTSGQHRASRTLLSTYNLLLPEPQLVGVRPQRQNGVRQRKDKGRGFRIRSRPGHLNHMVMIGRVSVWW